MGNILYINGYVTGCGLFINVSSIVPPAITTDMASTTHPTNLSITADSNIHGINPSTVIICTIQVSIQAVTTKNGSHRTTGDINIHRTADSLSTEITG